MNTSISIKTRQRPLLIYVLGWGRSGSSIMANVLGSLPGAASLGEVRYIWDRGALENTICGCGEEFRSCDFWSHVPFANTPFPDMKAQEARRLTQAIGSGARSSQIPALFNAGQRSRYIEKNKDDLQSVIAMYHNIFDRSGCNVIVDSSKSPFYAVNLLDEQRDFDVLFLHLTRDPRAVLHSWRKRKKREEGGKATYFPRYSALRSLLQWRFVNASCERFATLAPEAYNRIRYEDFVSDWKQSLVAGMPDLFDMSQIAGSEGPTVHAQHSISGNPSRFETGEITLRLDTAWEGQLRRRDAVLASQLVAGPARRYGYSI